MDLTWLYNKPFLHMVDIETEFQNAIFIKDKISTNLCNDFFNCWARFYTTFPETIRLDRETCFTSNEFRKNTDGLGIELIFCGIEEHNSIGQG